MTENKINNLEELKLEQTVRKGEVVGVKISSEAEWISDTVENVDSATNVLELHLLEKFISDDIMVDDVIECQIIHGEDEYILKGKIVDIGIIHPQKIMLEIDDIKRYKNLRKSKRYTVNLCGRIIYDDNEKSTFVTVKNISETGVSVICKEEIKAGEEVDVDIVLWGQEVLSIEGRVIRTFKTGKNFKYGIIIEYVSNHSRDLLRGFITEMEEKEKQLR